MNIDKSFYEEIRNLDVDEHKVSCVYDSWEKQFENDCKTKRMLSSIKSTLGQSFGRAEIVKFYQEENVSINCKFLSAMIWGYEAPAGSRRDNRGPARVKEMMNSPNMDSALSNVKIGSRKEILKAYKILNKDINKCGSSFLTKHLYFLGKSLDNENEYPLIMDDRVAVGLVKLALKDQKKCLDFVSIHAQRKASVYENYLDFASQQAKFIGCDLDKIEYFLFLRGG